MYLHTTVSKADRIRINDSVALPDQPSTEGCDVKYPTYYICNEGFPSRRKGMEHWTDTHTHTHTHTHRNVRTCSETYTVSAQKTLVYLLQLRVVRLNKSNLAKQSSGMIY